MTMNALEELQNDIVGLADIYEPDELIETFSNSFVQAALIEDQPDKIKILQDCAEALNDIIEEFWNDDE